MLKLKRYSSNTERNYQKAFQCFVSLGHSSAAHLLERGTYLRYIQNLLGHSNSKTTEIYTHIIKRSLDKIVSPLDNLIKPVKILKYAYRRNICNA